MTLEELRVITIVYVSALLPLILYFFYKEKIPLWIPKVYIGSFLLCALGWELWFTFGWIEGDPVNIRRSAVLNSWIPMNINWLLNSMADAGTISLGGLLMKLFQHLPLSLKANLYSLESSYSIQQIF